MNRIALLSLVSGVTAILAVSSRVDACGGCFAPPSETSVVTGHRMAFAISENRTVLWDQFEYNGDPAEFSWVLPVARGATIETSVDAWFETLESVTASRITAPALQCARATGGCGFGFAASDDVGSEGAFYDEGVTVVHRGTVGPYETVTLRSDGGDELRDWLDANGYFVPSDIDPIIDAYVSEGADFIALKLQPGRGVQQMTPVRVVTPHGDPILPLRMVAAGTGQYVDIVLYVIGEGRFGLPDLEETFIDAGALVWDFQAQESNYLEVRAEALQDFLGHTYLTTYAKRRAFFESAFDSNGSTIFYSVADGTSTHDNFSDLYFAQAAANDAAAAGDCALVRTALGSDALVSEEPVFGETRAEAFECDGYTDLSAAMIGMRPARTWLTRLELSLPREALIMDCVVEPATKQDPVDNGLVSQRSENRPDGCPQPVFTSSVAPSSTTPRLTAPLMLAAALAFGALRRLGRRR